jgi:hypothetical protein
MIARMAQGIRCLRLPDDADRGATFAQLAAQVSEVGVAGHEAESIGATVEMGLERIQRQRDIGSVLAR